MQIENISKLPETNLRQEIKREFTTFIQDFRDENGNRKYEQAAKVAIHSSKHHIMFAFRDLLHHNGELSTLIFSEFYKYEPIINEALTQFMHEFEKNQIQGHERREEEFREKYECSFDEGYDEVPDLSVRGLKCNLLGRLIKLRGTVTRTSEVRPELKVGVFKCRNCGKLSNKIIQQFKYT